MWSSCTSVVHNTCAWEHQEWKEIKKQMKNASIIMNMERITASIQKKNFQWKLEIQTVARAYRHRGVATPLCVQWNLTNTYYPYTAPRARTCCNWWISEKAIIFFRFCWQILLHVRCSFNYFSISADFNIYCRYIYIYIYI